jgi:hypothetical protein
MHKVRICRIIDKTSYGENIEEDKKVNWQQKKWFAERKFILSNPVFRNKH